MKISDLLLERYMIGEVTAKEKAEVELALRSDSALVKKWEALNESNEVILKNLPPSFFYSQIREKLESSPKSTKPSPISNLFQTFLSSSNLIFKISAPLLALVTIFFISTNTNSLENIETIKGDAKPTLIIYLKENNDSLQVRQLSSGETLKKGDTIQISYLTTTQLRFGAIFSIDGNGSVTLHYPTTPSSGEKLIPSKETLLPFSYTLDDAPLFENFYFIASEKPIDVSKLLEKVERKKFSQLENKDHVLNFSPSQATLHFIKQ